MTEPVRAYIYRVATALILVLGLYGVVSNDEAVVWRDAIEVVLLAAPSALAAKNTSTKAG